MDAPSSTVFRLVTEAKALSRDELYALHREVSRLASNERLRDPRYLGNYAAGMLHRRARDDA